MDETSTSSFSVTERIVRAALRRERLQSPSEGVLQRIRVMASYSLN